MDINIYFLKLYFEVSAVIFSTRNQSHDEENDTLCRSTHYKVNVVHICYKLKNSK